MSFNIGQILSSGALSGGVALIELLEPKLKPEIDIVQQDIADGKVTAENFEATFDTTIKTAEAYLPAEMDPFLDQLIPVIHIGIAFEAEVAKLIPLYPKA
jgi:hypothetical protein